MKMNGTVLVNGFVGDALFSTEIFKSFIHWGLARGHRWYFVELADGTLEKVVDVPIIFGSNQIDVDVPMVVVDRGFSMPYEGSHVIFGTQFLEDFEVMLSYKDDCIYSGVFGKIGLGLNRDFERFHEDRMDRDEILGYPLTYDSVWDRRVILLLDMDAFEVQVHQTPESVGFPRIVVNNSNRVVAVSYEAKLLGINRESTPTARQAKAICKNVIILRIPERSPGRIDTSIARKMTYKIVDTIKATMQSFPVSGTLEYSSGDEFYIDVTPIVDLYLNGNPCRTPNLSQLWYDTFLYGDDSLVPAPECRLHTVQQWINQARNYNQSLDSIMGFRLLQGARIATKFIQAIMAATGFDSSVGIACNKLMAKIASGVHKPGSITVALLSGFESFSSRVKVQDIPGLGGKKGQAIKDYLNQLCAFSAPGASSMNGLYHNCVQHIETIPLQSGADGMGRDEAFKVLRAASGFCTKEVKPLEHTMSISVSESLYNRKFEYSDIKEIAFDRFEEMADRILEDQQRNSRVPASIKLVIQVEGEKLGWMVREDLSGDTVALTLRNRWYESTIPRDWDPEGTVSYIRLVANFQ